MVATCRHGMGRAHVHENRHTCGGDPRKNAATSLFTTSTCTQYGHKYWMDRQLALIMIVVNKQGGTRRTTTLVLASRRVTYRPDLVLDAHGRCAAAVAAHAPVVAPVPRVHGAADAALHVRGDLRLELRRLEEGAREAVHPALQAAAEHQDGRLPHQLHERPRVPRHKRRRVGLQHRAAHLRVRAHHRRRTPQMRLEHLAVPENNRRTSTVVNYSCRQN